MVEHKLIQDGGDGQTTNLQEVEIELDNGTEEKDFNAKRGNRMSLSPVMQQIMQKQIEAIQQ